MTYLKLMEVKQQNKKLAKKLLYANLFIFTLIFIFTSLPAFITSKSSFIFILLPVYFLIPILFWAFTLPESIRKRRKQVLQITEEYKDKVIETHFAVLLPNSKHLNPLLKMIILISYYLIIFILVFIIYDLMINNVLYVAFVTLISGSTIYYALRLFFKFLDYEVILTDSHLIYNYSVAYTYESISKYQFIKLRNQDYLLDINTGKEFIRIRLNDSEKTSLANIWGLSPNITLT